MTKKEEEFVRHMLLHMQLVAIIYDFYVTLGLIFHLGQFDATLSNIPILLDNVICTGNERSLLQCSHNGFNKHNCDHYEDIVIECVGKIY